MSDTRTIIPAADIYETSDYYTIILDMPGTAKEKIEISAEDESLKIKAKAMEVEKDWKVVRTEFEMGDYERVFTIGGKVNRDSIEAKYENGILTLKLGKSEGAKPRKIEVKAA